LLKLLVLSGVPVRACPLLIELLPEAILVQMRILSIYNKNNINNIKINLLLFL